MKKTVVALMGLLVMSVAAFGQALTDANAVIEKYYQAVGGKSKLLAIQNITITMTADMQGRAMEMETKLKTPNKFKQSSYMMGNEVGGSVYDGTTFSRSMRGQQQTKEGAEAYREYLLAHPFPELLYDSLGITKTLVGTEDVEGKPAYVVELRQNETTWKDYFDVASGLKVQRKATMQGPRGTNEVAVRFGDYKKSGDILFPFSRSQRFGQFDMNFETQSVKINGRMDDKTFKVN